MTTDAALAPDTSHTTSLRRRDIQGLRGLAIIAVVFCHVKVPGFVGGYIGVDVFFVLSGYVITNSLIRTQDDKERLSLTSFWARRIRRILPAATVVIMVSGLLAYLLLPVTRWRGTAHDMLSSSLYVVNWSLSARAVNYLEQDESPSILQHYWSLAVEEQYYLIWPVLLSVSIYLCSRRARLTGFRTIETGQVQRAGLLAALAIAVPSFAWSCYYTAVQPTPAYFVSTTRLWEPALGAALVFLPGRLLKFPSRWIAAMAWIGSTAILGSVVSFHDSTSYPGWLALVPCAGACLVILAGTVGTSAPSRFLSSRAMTYVGDRSYSLYLWHWPLVVVVSYLFNGLGFYSALLVLALCFGLAWLSFRYVETPLLNSRRPLASRRATFKMGVMCILLGVLAATTLIGALNSRESTATLSEAPRADASVSAPHTAQGAQVLRANPELGVPVDSVAGFTPHPAAAALDNPSVYSSGCHQTAIEDAVVRCQFRYGSGARRIAIAGDSHAAQWVPALQTLAQSHGWILDSYTKSSCPVIDGTVRLLSAENYTSCTKWNADLRKTLRADKPDLLLISNLDYEMAGHPLTFSQQTKDAQFQDGLRSAWTELSADERRVVILRDTPQMGRNVPECVAEHPEQLTECAVDRAVALENAGTSQVAVATTLPRVQLIDLTASICPAERCSAVIGGVLVYRDSQHLTATYSRTLAPDLEDALRRLPNSNLR